MSRHGSELGEAGKFSAEPPQFRGPVGESDVERRRRCRCQERRRGTTRDTRYAVSSNRSEGAAGTARTAEAGRGELKARFSATG
jgi:hypothetical protein